jgi:hypothetical protein
MRLALDVWPFALAVCRLPAGAAWPREPGGAFVAVTRAAGELSVVCEEGSVPAGARVEAGWRALRVRGPLAFEVVGVVASISAPLAEAGVPVFVISTFDTDYVLVKVADVDRAVAALRSAGHEVAGA